MQPHNAIALESLSHSIRCTLSSMSELEGSEALPHKSPRLQCAQLTAQGWPPLLFIAPRTNIAVTPSLGEFSQRPDAPVELTIRAAPCPIALCCPHVLHIQPRPPNPPMVTARQRSNTMTGRAPRNDRTRQFQRPVTVQRGSRELLS
jgi:hypothetical protein